MKTILSALAVRVTYVVMLITLGIGFAPRGLAAEPREQWEHPRPPVMHREEPSFRREEPSVHRGVPESQHVFPGEVRHFHEVIVPRWRTGHWVHGPHLGRAGWWWVVEGEWYAYPEPIYPYPDPYVPPDLVAGAPPVPPAPPNQYWYYCPSAGAYYPYVAACPEGWTPVVPPAG